MSRFTRFCLWILFLVLACSSVIWAEYRPIIRGLDYYTEDASSDISWTGDITPPQITAQQDDYNPTGLSTASTLRLNSDASQDITGLQGGADGRIILVHNIGAQDIVLKDENASSSAANRFALNSDVTIQADNLVFMQYDSTSTRWRVIAVGVTDHGVLTGLTDDDHTQYILVGGTRAFTGEQSMGTNKLTNVVDPTVNQDAATKKYVDDNVGAPGGANTQVQFNDSGVFGGDAGLIYNKTTNQLSVLSGGLNIQRNTASGIPLVVKTLDDDDTNPLLEAQKSDGSIIAQIGLKEFPGIAEINQFIMENVGALATTRFQATNYSTGLNNNPDFGFRKSHSNSRTNVTLVNNERLGLFTFSGVNSGVFAVAATFAVEATAAGGTVRQPSRFIIQTTQVPGNAGSDIKYSFLNRPETTWLGASSTLPALLAAQFQVVIPTSTRIGQIIKGAASQSVSLFRLTDSSNNIYLDTGDGLTSSEFVGNQQGVDIDFRWEGGTDTELLQVNAGQDAVIIGGTNPDSLFEVDGAQGLAIETITGNTTLNKTHSTVLVNASGNVTITLPAAASAYNNTDNIGRIYEIKKIDADADTVEIDGNGSETIDGGLTAVLTVQYEAITIVSDGSNWHIV